MAQYYKTINGKKYDRSLLELADSVTQGRGDGRISIQDAKLILKDVMDASSYTDVEKFTIQYIRKNYKFTKAADDFFRKEIRTWAATKPTTGKKKKKSKSSVPKTNTNQQKQIENVSFDEVPKSRKLVFIFLFILVVLILAFLIYSSHCSINNSVQNKEVTNANLTNKSDKKNDQKKLESIVLLFPKNGRSLGNTQFAEQIKQAVQILNTNPDWKIEIQGHTCSEDKSGANQRISEQRARLVYNELLKNKIQKSRLIIRGYSDAKPAFSNDSEDGRLKNRRVVFRVLHEFQMN